MKKARVLFLCTGNPARSQMAEGLLRNLAVDRFEVDSAGTSPKGIHPRTIEVMNEIGIDVNSHRIAAAHDRRFAAVGGANVGEYV